MTSNQSGSPGHNTTTSNDNDNADQIPSQQNNSPKQYTTTSDKYNNNGDIPSKQPGSPIQKTAKSNVKGNVDQNASKQTTSHKQNTTTPNNSDKVDPTPSKQSTTVPTDSGTHDQIEVPSTLNRSKNNTAKQKKLIKILFPHATHHPIKEGATFALTNASLEDHNTVDDIAVLWQENVQLKSALQSIKEVLARVK